MILSAQAEVALVKRAIDDWERYTCLTFPVYNRRIHNKYVYFKEDTGKGCWSRLGYQYHVSQRAQFIELTPTCRQVNTQVINSDNYLKVIKNFLLSLLIYFNPP